MCRCVSPKNGRVGKVAAGVGRVRRLGGKRFLGRRLVERADVGARPVFAEGQQWDTHGECHCEDGDFQRSGFHYSSPLRGSLKYGCMVVANRKGRPFRRRLWTGIEVGSGASHPGRLANPCAKGYWTLVPHWRYSRANTAAGRNILSVRGPWLTLFLIWPISFLIRILSTQSLRGDKFPPIGLSGSEPLFFRKLHHSLARHQPSKMKYVVEQLHLPGHHCQLRSSSLAKAADCRKRPHLGRTTDRWPEPRSRFLESATGVIHESSSSRTISRESR